MSKLMNARMFAAALVFSFFAGTVIAADANKPMPKPPHERGQMRQDVSQMRLNHLTEILKLDDKQKEQLKPILEDEMKQRRELMQDKTIAPEQKRAKMQEIAKSTDSKIEQVLTPEQKDKFQKMREEQKARMEARRAARQSKPVPDSNSEKK